MTISTGCVPVVINRGGQPEVVRNLIDGFLWNNTEELKKYTLKLISNNNLWQIKTLILIDLRNLKK